MSRARLLRARWRQVRGDDGSTMVVALILVGVMFAFFGLGLDIMHLAYLRASLGNDLDQAVTSAVAQTRVGADGRLVVDEARAQAVYEQVYAANRARYGALQCLNQTAFVSGGSGQRKCWFDGGLEVDPDGRGVTVTVVERTNNFLGVFWESPVSRVLVTSRAVIRQQGPAGN